jgi:hypothetical protein
VKVAVVKTGPGVNWLADNGGEELAGRPAMVADEVPGRARPKVVAPQPSLCSIGTSR